MHSLVIHIVVRLRNFESHVQIPDLCVPVKDANIVENSVLQALLFQEVSAHRILLGETGIIHYWPN
jgi:hypothetical protein